MTRDLLKYVTRHFIVGPERKLASKTVHRLSPSEKVIVGLLTLVFGVSSLLLAGQVNSALLFEVPARGGTLTEGVIGFPRFVNPLLATSDADNDLVMLVYSGLMRANPDGTLVPDIAESFEVSEDGLVYAFTIRENAVFHDGHPVNSSDVLFTVEKAQDPILKSPRRANWEGVRVEAIDERTVAFTLEQPYAPFLENTTIGILPEHIWSPVTSDQFPFSEFNIEAVGSGPYKIASVQRNSAGVPDQATLRAFDDFILGSPNISTIELRFYSNEEGVLAAYRGGSVESISRISPAQLENINETSIQTVALPRIFAVFMNQNLAPIFSEQEVREALSRTVNRQQIVENVLLGFGSTIGGPFPPGILPRNEEPENAALLTPLEQAAAVLEPEGWELGDDGVWVFNDVRLSFALATSNAPELKAVAGELEQVWESAGFEVDLQIFEPGALNQNVIRSRQYQTLLFGQVIGRELDLFAFWHSSQITDPGLNVALYTNITTDALLEEARETFDRDERLEIYKDFDEEVRNDVGAIFLYSPDFIYVLPEKIHGVDLGTVTASGERFLDVHTWYIETNYVWDFFLQN